MTEKTIQTSCGTIHYWVNGEAEEKALQLVFLPGLTADHRLFEKQIAYFEGRYPVLVWDAPGHSASWPFELTFTLMDKARWLDEILQREGFASPVLIGQSMGGYLSQAYLQLFPEKPKGFISIDSAPLQREYMTAAEIWLLKRMEPVYRRYPWKALLRDHPDLENSLTEEEEAQIRSARDAIFAIRARENEKPEGTILSNPFYSDWYAYLIRKE